MRLPQLGGSIETVRCGCSRLTQAGADFLRVAQEVGESAEWPGVRVAERRAATPRHARDGKAEWRDRKRVGYSAFTAAVRSARPCFASANSIPVLGLTYSSLSMPA
jgi:hypothetical protein